MGEVRYKYSTIQKFGFTSAGIKGKKKKLEHYKAHVSSFSPSLERISLQQHATVT